MKPTNKIWRLISTSLLATVLLAFVIRAFVGFLLYADHLLPERNFWEFGWEMGQVAYSIATGHGFSNPMYVHTSGPTAWMAPVYPYLIATVFKVFGIHTAAASKAMLTLNALFAALTCIPVFHISRRTFGLRIARISAWVWALFPYSIYLSIGRIWENTLTTMLGAFAIHQTLRLTDEDDKTGKWVQWALIWAVIAMTSPVLLSTLPFLGIWVLLERRKYFGLRFSPAKAALAAVVFLACIAPWTVRNHQTFRHFIPLRDNFWLEFHVGNNPDTSDVWPDSSHPTTDGVELKQWIELGEYRYMQAKKAESIAYVTENPGKFAVAFARHVVFTWTGFWSLNPSFLAKEPLHLPNVLFTTTLTLMLGLGLWFARYEIKRGPITPFVIMIAVFPALYYITHPSMDYRHPLDIIIVIFGSYGAVRLYEERETLLYRQVFTARCKRKLAPKDVFASESQAD